MLMATEKEILMALDTDVVIDRVAVTADTSKNNHGHNDSQPRVFKYNHRAIQAY